MEYGHAAIEPNHGIHCAMRTGFSPQLSHFVTRVRRLAARHIKIGRCMPPLGRDSTSSGHRRQSLGNKSHHHPRDGWQACISPSLLDTQPVPAIHVLTRPLTQWGKCYSCGGRDKCDGSTKKGSTKHTKAFLVKNISLLQTCHRRNKYRLARPGHAFFTDTCRHNAAGFIIIYGDTLGGHRDRDQEQDQEQEQGRAEGQQYAISPSACYISRAFSPYLK